MHGNRKTNKVLEDHGEWLLVDISTLKHPSATMAVDAGTWAQHGGGRVSASYDGGRSYIRARYQLRGASRSFHQDVLPIGKGTQVDHIKYGTMSFVDNRKGNLRPTTPSQNRMNQGLRRDSTSGLTGVSWHKNRSSWRAHITVEGKTVHLGLFDNIDFAIGARKQAEREHFGEFAFGATQ